MQLIVMIFLDPNDLIQYAVTFEMQLSVVKMPEGSTCPCEGVAQLVLPSQLILIISCWQLYTYNLVTIIHWPVFTLNICMRCCIFIISSCSNPWVVGSEAIQ